MGLYDRDYAREEPTGLRIGADWSAVVTIIVVCVGVSFVNLLSVSQPVYPQGFLNEHGALRADLLQKPWQAWQLLTYGWLHNNASPGHLIGNMLTLWAFGTHAEGLLFTKARFYRFYVSSLIIAGLGWVCATHLYFNRMGMDVLPIPVFGASGGVAAVVCYSILCNPYRTMLLYFVEVPAWVIGVLMLSYDIWGTLGYGFGNVAYSAHIFGALAGLLFYKTGWCLADVIPWRWLGFQYQRLQRPGSSCIVRRCVMTTMNQPTKKI